MRFPPLLALALSVVSTCFASRARAEEPGAPIAVSAPPSADLPPPSARTNLIIGGAVTTAVAYGLSLGSYFLVKPEDFRPRNDLRIPFAGPWMALGHTACPPSTPVGCNKVSNVIAGVFEVLDGVAQIGGLGLLGEGLFMSTSAPRARKAEGPTVHAMPLNFENGGVGLGVFGTF